MSTKGLILAPEIDVYHKFTIVHWAGNMIRKWNKTSEIYFSIYHGFHHRALHNIFVMTLTAWSVR